jgi:hypothetical protein
MRLYEERTIRFLWWESKDGGNSGITIGSKGCSIGSDTYLLPRSTLLLDYSVGSARASAAPTGPQLHQQARFPSRSEPSLQSAPDHAVFITIQRCIGCGRRSLAPSHSSELRRALWSSQFSGRLLLLKVDPTDLVCSRKRSYPLPRVYLSMNRPGCTYDVEWGS